MNDMNLYLGIDNTQPRIVRTMFLSIHSGGATSPLAWASSRDLGEFLSSWQTSLDKCLPAAAATTVLEHDPGDLAAWFSERGIPLIRYDKYLTADLAPCDDEEDVPKGYRRAYALALRVAFEARAPRILEELWSEIYWMELRLEQLHMTANRLSVVVPF